MIEAIDVQTNNYLTQEPYEGIVKGVTITRRERLGFSQMDRGLLRKLQRTGDIRARTGRVKSLPRCQGAEERPATVKKRTRMESHILI